MTWASMRLILSVRGVTFLSLATSTRTIRGVDIGLPSFVLVNGARARVTEGDEALKMIEAVFSGYTLSVPAK